MIYWVHAEKDSPGQRIRRVRRIRVNKLPPLLINWSSIGDIIQSPLNKDIEEDNEAAASDLTFSGGYLAPPPDAELDSSINDFEQEFIPPLDETKDSVIACSVIEETVYEEVTEEQCKTENITLCQQSEVECNIVKEVECHDVTETRDMRGHCCKFMRGCRSE